MKRWMTRSLEAALALTVLQAVVGGLLFADAPPQAGALPGALLANAITALLVTFVAGAFAAFVAWRTGDGLSRIETPPGRSTAGWAFRIVLGALAYVVAYFTAGLAAFPFVADFYAGRAMPPVALLPMIQVLRGLGFVGVALLMVRWLRTSRGESAILVGLRLSVVGGVAPLLVPNQYLPGAVRMVHLVEVGVSNFLFGLFVGWLVASPSDSAERARAASLAA